MAHATISDVFNAGMSAASPFLQEGTAQLKAKNDIIIKNQLAQVSIAYQNFENANQNLDPQQYEGKLGEAVDQWYDSAFKANTSRYYQERMTEAKAATMGQLRIAMAQHKFVYETKQEQVRYNQDVQNIIDSDKEPAWKLQAYYERNQQMADEGRLDPIQLAAADTQAVQSVYSTSMESALEQVKNVQDVDAVMQHVQELMLPAVRKQQDAEGKELPFNFEGKEKFDEAVKKQTVQRIQEDNGNLVQGAQGQFERYITEGNFDAAISLGKEWSKTLQGMYKTQNLSDTQKNQFGRYFDYGSIITHVRGSGSSGGSSGSRQAKAPARGSVEGALSAFNINSEVYIQAYWDKKPLNGYTFDTMQEALNTAVKVEFNEFCYANLGYAPRNQEEYDALPSDIMAIWQETEVLLVEKLEKAVWSRMPDELKPHYQRLIDYRTYILGDSKKDKEKEYESRFYDSSIVKNMTPEEKDVYAQKLISFSKQLIFDEGVRDPAVFNQRVQNFISGDIGKRVALGKKPSGKTLAAASAAAQSGAMEDALFTTRTGRPQEGKEPGIAFIDKKAEEDALRLREAERKIAAEYLGMKIDDIGADWLKSENNRNEKIAKGEFIVKEGQNKGRYKVEYDSDKKPYLVRYADGRWVKFGQSVFRDD